MAIDSPCSVPDWLRFKLPLETERQQAACRRHDARYERSGDRRARLVSDLVFTLDLLGVPEDVLAQVMQHGAWCDPPEAMDCDRAEQYFWGVRQYGFTHWADGDYGGAQPPKPPEPTEAP